MVRSAHLYVGCLTFGCSNISASSDLAMKTSCIQGTLSSKNKDSVQNYNTTFGITCS